MFPVIRTYRVIGTVWLKKYHVCGVVTIINSKGVSLDFYLLFYSIFKYSIANFMPRFRIFCMSYKAHNPAYDLFLSKLEKSCFFANFLVFLYLLWHYYINMSTRSLQPSSCLPWKYAFWYWHDTTRLMQSKTNSRIVPLAADEKLASTAFIHKSHQYHCKLTTWNLTKMVADNAAYHIQCNSHVFKCSFFMLVISAL